jgi:hypothetical protein
MSATQDFKVIAKSRSALRVSKHGISMDKGGAILHEETFQFPHTPYYLACEIIQDQFPNCEVLVKTIQSK